MKKSRPIHVPSSIVDGEDQPITAFAVLASVRPSTRTAKRGT